jgi:hypothetical protein
MALTAGAGAAAQHAILLWPFHLLVIAAALSRLPLRAAAAVTAVLCTSNLAVTNQYYADLVRNGPAIRWTDAMDPLHQYLEDSGFPDIVMADWGIMETMNLLSEGRLPIFYADTATPEGALRTVSAPDRVFVGHPPPYAFHPQEREALEQAARQAGYQEENITTIYDRNGRPAFDVFRFRKLHL